MICKKLDGQVFASDEGLSEYLSPGPALLDPVEGLTVKEGYECTECVYRVPELKSIQRHYSETHRHAEKSWTRGYMQTIYPSRRAKYFGIIYPVDVANRSEDGDSSTLRLFEQQLSETSSACAPDHRLLSPFLQTFRWHELVLKHFGTDVTAIRISCSFPNDKKREDDQLLKVHDSVEIFWNAGQDLIGKGVYLIERVLMSKTPGELSSSGFTRIRSVKRHARELTRLISFCWRNASRPTGAGAFSFNELDENVRDFVNSTRDASSNSSDRLRALGKVLNSLFAFEKRRTFGSKDFADFLVLQFLAVRSVKGDTVDTAGFAQFKPPGSVTSTAAILIYWIRLYLLVRLAREEVKGSEDGDERQVHQFVLDGLRTPFNSLQEAIRLGSTLAYAPEERRPPQLTWNDDSCESLAVEGRSVTLNCVSTVINELQRKFHFIFETQILRGFCASKLRERIRTLGNEIVDDYRNEAPGYCFMDDKRNGFHNHTKDLLEHFMSSRHRNYFVVGETANGSDIFNTRNVQNWCDAVDEATRLLVGYTHLASGQPARGEELATYTLRNTVNGLRGYYFYKGHIMLLQQYHKGMSIIPLFKLIARFLPKSMTETLVVFFVSVRPMQTFFTSKLHVPDEDRAEHLAKMNQYMFVQGGKPYTGLHCRSDIELAFLSTANLHINFRLYRHIAIAFMEKHIDKRYWRGSRDSGSDEERETRGDLPFHHQATHSRVVASRLYARSSNDPYILDRDVLHQYFQCSKVWHKTLHLDLDSSSRQNQVSLVSSLEVHKSHQASIPLEVNMNAPTNPTLHAPMVPGIADTQGLAQHDALTGYQRISKQIDTLKNQLEAIQKAVSTRQVRTTSNALVGTQLRDFFGSQFALRTFWGNENATWKSKEQCVAMTLILKKSDNLLVVLKTGGGKSCLYLAPAKISSRTTFVIIPFVALMLQAVKNASRHNIEATEYKEGANLSSFRIVFVTAEQCVKSMFQTTVWSMIAQDQVDRIVFDEAHLVLTSSSFRQAFSSVFTLARFGVPKVLLSATLPPQYEEKLKEAVGFPYSCVRQETSRPNLKYRVVTTNMVSMVSACVQEMISSQMSHPNKGIVFVLTKDSIQRISNEYLRLTGKRVARFSSEMPLSDKIKEIKSWQSEQVDFIIATSAFGQGVDYGHVTAILHFGGSRSFIDYAQETGRGGRDSQLCECVTIFSEEFLNGFVSRVSCADQERHDFTRMKKFFADSEPCRRQSIQVEMDGDGLPCVSDAQNAQCDNCVSHLQSSSMPRTQADPSQSIIRESELARSLRIEDAKAYNAIIRFMSAQQDEAYCTVCWLQSGNKSARHLPIKCPNTIRKCLRCLGPHNASKCNVKRIPLPHGTCFLCGLPTHPVLTDRDIHFSPAMGSDCKSPAKDRIIPGVWYYYRNLTRRCTSEFAKSIFALPEVEFATWLSQKRNRAFTNLVLVWAAILDNSINDLS